MPLVARALIPEPAPAKAYIAGIASAPNFILFNNFLPASAEGSACTSLSNSVGPASNTSPIVPMFSTSATNVSPAAPPTAIAANFCLLDNLFNFFALSEPFNKFFALGFKYRPAFFALSALEANVVASFAPATEGTPI